MIHNAVRLTINQVHVDKELPIEADTKVNSGIGKSDRLFCHFEMTFSAVFPDVPGAWDIR